jgi:hypothetical protein
LDIVDASQRRRIRAQPQLELIESAARPFHLGGHTVAGVGHRSGQAQFSRKGVDERAKSHTLDNAVHPHVSSAPVRPRQDPHTSTRCCTEVRSISLSATLRPMRPGGTPDFSAAYILEIFT